MGDLDLDRERYRRAEPTAGPDLPGLPGEAAFVGRVTTAAPAVGHYTLVTRQDVGGVQTEGSAGTFAARTAGIPVYLVGPAAPVTGDNLVVRWSDHRWVAERGTGGGGLTTFACGTNIPNTLHLTYCGVAITLNVVTATVSTYPGDWAISRPHWFGMGTINVVAPSSRWITVTTPFFHNVSTGTGPITAEFYWTCSSGLYIVARQIGTNAFFDDSQATPMPGTRGVAFFALSGTLAPVNLSGTSPGYTTGTGGPAVIETGVATLIP